MAIEAACTNRFCAPRQRGPALRAGVAVLALLVSDVAFGQSQASVVEEITVTARHREERLQDVPISITAITSGELEKTGANRFFDIGFSVPNVTLLENSGAPSFPVVTIRGIEGRAGIYVDDVVMGDGSGFNTYLMDVDRLEVLRGPQGTLFGRNTISGAVNTITRKPTDQFEATADATFGNYDLRQFRAALSGPIVADKVGGTISAVYRERAGFNRLLGNGRVNDEYGFGGRAKLLFRPSDNLEITVSGDTDYQDPHPFYYKAFRPVAPGAAPVVIRPFDDDTVEAGPQAQKNQAFRRIYGVSVKADYTFNDYTLTSITAKRWTKYNLQRDADYTAQDIFYFNFPNQYQQFSQEVRLSSPQDQALTWVAGLFYFTDRKKTFSDFSVGPDFPAAPGLTLGQLFRLGLSPVDRGNTTTTSRQGNESRAIFGSVTYKFNDALSLTAGGRYSADTIDLTTSSLSTPGFGSTTAPVSFSKNEYNFSPSGSLNYKITPNITTYATVSQGWYRGGFNSAAVISFGGRTFAPEKMTNYEVGLKSVLFDRKVVANLALFYMDYSNLQRTQAFIVPGQGTVSTTTNAASAVSKGVELDISARPIRGLDLTARAGFEDARYQNYKNAPVLDAQGNPGVFDISGTSLPFAPRWTFSFGAQYTMPLYGSTELTFGGEYQYRSRYQLNSGFADFFKVGSTELLNFNAGIQDADGKWGVIGRVKNATDRRYVNGMDVSFGNEFIQLSDPRIYTVELRVRF